MNVTTVATASKQRVKLTPEEKRFRDAQYRVSVGEFRVVLNNLVAAFAFTLTLQRGMSQLDKGSYLKFTRPGLAVPFNFTSKDMKNVREKFVKDLLDLKTYFRVSKKKFKAPVLPSSFTSTYIPVFAAPTLKAFFNIPNINFGTASLGRIPEWKDTPLLQQLPYVKNGYFLRNTATMLFYIYGRVNNMQIADDAQYVRATQDMINTFGSMRPAFISTRNAEGKLVKVRAPLDTNQTTFSAIANAYPQGLVNKKGKPADFNPAKFNKYFYQNIAASNYYSEITLPKGDDLNILPNQQQQEFREAAANMSNQEFRQALLREHEIVSAVNTEWKELLEPQKKEEQKQKKKAKALQEKAAKAAAAQNVPVINTLAPPPVFQAQ